MMLSLAIFKLLVAVLISAAAAVLERGLERLTWPRRWLWIAAILLTCTLPPMSISRDGAAARTDQGPLPAGSIANPGTGVVGHIRSDYQHILVDWPQLDQFIAPLSQGLRGFALLLVCFGWLSQRYVLKSTRAGAIDHAPVLLSGSAGPAVVGLMNPRILVPEWLVGMPKPVRDLVIAHERSHIRARDHWLLLGLMLFIAATADLATIGLILWQFSRFRFAIEVDCDRRVLAKADPITYAHVLLTIAERRCGLLIGAPALVEGPSNLERRIQSITSEAQRASSLGVQLPVVLSAVLLLTAARLDAPLAPYPRLVQWIHSHREVALPAEMLAGYAGTYRSEDGLGAVQFAVDGNRLVAVMETGLDTLNSGDAFVPESADDFLLVTPPHRSVRLTFCDIDRYGQSATIAVNDRGRFTTLRRIDGANTFDQRRSG